MAWSQWSVEILYWTMVSKGVYNISGRDYIVYFLCTMYQNIPQYNGYNWIRNHRKSYCKPLVLPVKPIVSCRNSGGSQSISSELRPITQVKPVGTVQAWFKMGYPKIYSPVFEYHSIPVCTARFGGEVSRSETYRRGWFLWMMDGRANPPMDSKSGWSQRSVVVVVVAMSL